MGQSGARRERRRQEEQDDRVVVVVGHFQIQGRCVRGDGLPPEVAICERMQKKTEGECGFIFRKMGKNSSAQNQSARLFSVRRRRSTKNKL